ncbi:glycerophosphoryl diester phosphodiesterase [Filimonas effusa]|uniref:Glycerophosphoryl diester phosphodiesterase n=2 Tax=Filimonas effusa TaxID=2508721 RepID=A0A4V1MAY4_9BACT|nr:glycerophosphoryl diester phosphodiesterase [Filimonas effusa]
MKLLWNKQQDGWHLQSLSVKNKTGWTNLDGVNGEYTLLYTAGAPDSIVPVTYSATGQQTPFPEEQYRYIIPLWKEAIKPVPMNTAGTALHFYPAVAKQQEDNIGFSSESREAVIKTDWRFDKAYTNDILVTMSLEAKQDGFFSLATPCLSVAHNNQFNWAAIPGYFQGKAIEEDLVKAYAYGQGIPAKPVIVRERAASTLSPLVTDKQGVTVAVIPEPGIGRNPWAHDVVTQSEWLLGLSLMNRKGNISPTLYHPVLGHKGSFLRKGEKRSFTFRYTVKAADWYPVYKHAAEDIYRLKEFLHLKQTKQSLTNRVLSMHGYVTDDSTSKWEIEQYKGMEIGAQQYLGGVYGSEKDAVKNSDYGAMWMMAAMMQDSLLQQTRLPFARNFKLAQQALQHDFFNGAAAGQYYLTKSKRFTEEWGPYVEPIGTTYYMMLDIGNVLLFEPGDTALRNELRMAADKLLAWMKPAGNWAVAYDHTSTKELFTDVEDLRPTFYGLLVAYQLLGDKKYLTAACKGADWYIAHAVNEGHFLGVCGDTRFVPDFATGQSVQALLDLFRITADRKYYSAAIDAAKIYTTSIYTHPIPSLLEKKVNGVNRKDWEISQVGLSFEHGGILGSANNHGPILLASHAGMFVRLFSLTGDSLFLDMARTAAWGRDAFVDPATSVASYYWNAMNRGAGPFPHHAWWQVGWIVDYLMSEAELRSNGQVQFPRGFITPKVGPHQTYGFKEGTVFGTKAKLLLKSKMVKIDNEYIDYYAAINEKQGKLFIILLNNDDEGQHLTISLNVAEVLKGAVIRPQKTVLRTAAGKTSGLGNTNQWKLSLPAYGMNVLEINYR